MWPCSMWWCTAHLCVALHYPPLFCPRYTAGCLCVFGGARTLVCGRAPPTLSVAEHCTLTVRPCTTRSVSDRAPHTVGVAVPAHSLCGRTPHTLCGRAPHTLCAAVHHTLSVLPCTTHSLCGRAPHTLCAAVAAHSLCGRAPHTLCVAVSAHSLCGLAPHTRCVALDHTLSVLPCTTHSLCGRAPHTLCVAVHHTLSVRPCTTHSLCGRAQGRPQRGRESPF